MEVPVSQVSLSKKTATADDSRLQKDNERTPNKEEPNEEVKKGSCNEQQRTTLRRSARTVVKPKRYDDTPPKLAIQDKTSPKGKSTTKRKAKVVPVKTPKSCSKVLFRKTRNDKKRTRERRKGYTIAKLQEILMELDPPSPPTIPILTLNDMTVEEIMETFERNKLKLDALFQKIKSEGYIYSYEGLNHYLVIELLTNDLQNAMMGRLSEIYETESSPKYGSHVINVLMPEWILNIFMERYSMERDEAVRHIKEQNSYTVQLIGQQET